MKNIFLDTETCGLHGLPILLQYSEDDNEDIILYNFWTNKISKTLELIEYLVQNNIIGFNIIYDWFHIIKIYNIFSLVEDKDIIPNDHIDKNDFIKKDSFIMKLVDIEYNCRKQALCLKPAGCFDLLLHARTTKYQCTMDRKNIKIKKVPTLLAWKIINELNKRISMSDILFARQKDIQERWKIQDIEGDDDFKNIVLRFKPSAALKTLVSEIFDIKTTKFNEIQLDKNYLPEEYGYAPFAKSSDSLSNWASKIKYHIEHWEYNELARIYAKDDVKYTRGLYQHFGCPEINDTNSILAIMCANTRWKGYNVDLKKIQELRNKRERYVEMISNKVNINAPKKCKEYLLPVMNRIEQAIVKQSTKSAILEEISKWVKEEVCEKCNGSGCSECEEGFIKSKKKHPAAIRAIQILKGRKYKKEIEVYNKILLAGRFHTNFNIVGTLSNRMSGSGGLNPQGISHNKEVRSCFPLADDDMVLCGGDFDMFEVSIMDAVYQDPKLRSDLQAGKKLHAVFGTYLFPGNSYEDIMNSDKLPGERNLYKKAKSGLFAIGYGGNAYTLQTRLGVDQESAEQAVKKFMANYSVMGNKRKRYNDMFCSMKQPDGIGTKVIWEDAADSIESLFGFKRYYTLENMICKELFKLAENPPKEWLDLKIKVMRNSERGLQLAGNSVRSALFAAAFGLQSANMRSAGNHVIQSTGATITKDLQIKIWEHQPFGIHNFKVVPLNIHDEIMCPTDPSIIEDVKETVNKYIESQRDKVPLIGMKWKVGMKSWAEK